MPIQQSTAMILTLFLEGGPLLRFYIHDITPKVDLAAMSLEDVLGYIFIVGNHLYRFGVRRKKISKQLSLLYRRHRVGLGLSKKLDG